MRLIHATKIGLQLRYLATKFLRCPQGRRHGFESGGGGNFASEASKKNFLTPHFLASGGDKILLR